MEFKNTTFSMLTPAVARFLMALARDGGGGGGVKIPTYIYSSSL